MISVATVCDNTPTSQAAKLLAKHFQNEGMLTSVWLGGSCQWSCAEAKIMNVRKDLVAAATDADYIVFVSSCHIGFVKPLRKCGVILILLLSDEWLNPVNIPILKYFDVIVCPFMYQAELLRDDYGLKNMIYIPHTFNLPLTTKGMLTNPNQVHVGIVLPHGMSDSDISISNYLYNKLVSENVTTSLIPLSKRAQKITKQPLNTLSNILAGQVDVLINMTSNDPFCVTTIQSISAGVPTLCRTIMGNTELVMNYKNGVLIPEFPFVLDIANCTVDVIFEIFGKDNMFRKMRTGTADSLTQKNNEFIVGWRNLVL